MIKMKVLSKCLILLGCLSTPVYADILLSPVTNLLSNTVSSLINPLVPANENLTGPFCNAALDTTNGEWPLHGANTNNDRNQVLEKKIGPSTINKLKVAWDYNVGYASGITNVQLWAFNGTPTVSKGCVFVGDSKGEVIALDAKSGQQLWRTLAILPTDTAASFAGYIVSSVIVWNDIIMAAINRLGDGSTVGPYMVGINIHNGQVLWRSDSISKDLKSYTNANPVVFNDGKDGTVVIGYSVPEGDPTARGGYALLDAKKGTLLFTTKTITDTSQCPITTDALGNTTSGCSGGNVWSAPAIDTNTKHAYIGTGNPYNKQQISSPLTNAILKVDIDRKSASFGKIINYFTGEPEQAYPLIAAITKPSCDLFGGDRTLYNIGSSIIPQEFSDVAGTFANSYQCGQLNLGFPAVQLFSITDPSDPSKQIPVVGGLHKAGIYHALKRSDMTELWKTIIGTPPCEVCNASSAAIGENKVFVSVEPGPAVRSMNRNNGQAGWFAPLVDGAHYESVSTANGVVYTLDNLGFLNAFDANTGWFLAKLPIPVLASKIQAGMIAHDTLLGVVAAAGISIAEGKIFINIGSHVMAFDLAN